MSFKNLFLLFSILLFHSSLLSQQVYTAPAPNWVKKYDALFIIDTNQIKKIYTDGNSMKIYQEVQLNVDLDEMYVKGVNKITNEKQNYDQIILRHSPKDTKRKIVSVSLVKDNKELDISKHLNWTESISNEYVFNKLWESEKNVKFTIDKIQKGDLYSLSYFDKSLRDDASFDEGLSFSCPDSSLINFRLLSKEPLKFKTFNGFPSVKVIPHDVYFEYVATGVAITPYKRETPKNFYDWPFIIMSKYESIDQVGLAYKDQFNVDSKSNQMLDSLYKNLVKEEKNDSLKIKTIINYVQDTMVYQDYGLVRSYSPDWCIQGNRGDCKAKTLIAVELFKRAGIKAYPVLVNLPEYPRQLDAIPSILNFNHVITQFIFNKDTILMDPTATNQTDKLGAYPIPNHGKSLVIYDDQIVVKSIQPHNIGKVVIIDTISNQVKRKVILNGEILQEYRTSNFYSNVQESIFEYKFNKINTRNHAIHDFSEFEYSSAQRSKLNKQFYNSVSQDSLVITQKMFFPDSLAIPFLKTNIRGGRFSSSYFSSDNSKIIDSLYTGPISLKYVNQSTAATYIKDKIPLQEIHLDTINTDYKIETEFGYYHCKIFENETSVEVKQDIYIFGELPTSRLHELDDFKTAMKTHQELIADILLAKEEKEEASEQTNYDWVKTGYFQNTENDDENIHIKRTKKHQVEINKKSGVKIKLKIDWFDERHYKLIFVKGNALWDKSPNSNSTPNLYVKIIEFGEDYYVYKTRFEGESRYGPKTLIRKMKKSDF